MSDLKEGEKRIQTRLELPDREEWFPATVTIKESQLTIEITGVHPDFLKQYGEFLAERLAKLCFVLRPGNPPGGWLFDSEKNIRIGGV